MAIPENPVVLVTGGRHYADAATVAATLKALNPGRVIHGGATGADTLADRWARANGVEVRTYCARWNLHGKAAGPLRNEMMLQHERPHVVVAFPGGRGTRDMIGRARRAGVTVQLAGGLGDVAF